MMIHIMMIHIMMIHIMMIHIMMIHIMMIHVMMIHYDYRILGLADKQQSNQDMEGIYELERRLAAAQIDHAVLRDPTANYRKV